ncbi:hypothetical protein [Paenibacillus eucommiae]|uniref:Integral membrane protein n=1 Tax=Paenibacillus eucommiae TaxID=1355755 RepID=A0ABS4J517_9BACL|nr:hypothetical protein [Paenibacillus eucommiae]MBP1994941.1 putative integral membrane protein [Paenibacillus eucommiae]
MVKIWWNLFKKELAVGSRMSMPIWASVLLFLCMGGASLFLASFFKSGLVSQVWLLVIYFHFIAPSVYMMMSLYKERERWPLWLQLPLRGWQLLAAKLAAASVELIMGLVVSVCMFLWVFELEDSNNFWEFGTGEGASTIKAETTTQAQYFYDLLRGEGIWSALGFIFIAIGIAVVLVLLYMIAKSLTNRFGRWRWPVAIVLFGAISLLEYIFEQTKEYSFLFRWGHLSGLESEPIYIGEGLWIFLIMIVSLYAAGWLLDRKVEVN